MKQDNSIRSFRQLALVVKNKKPAPVAKVVRKYGQCPDCGRVHELGLDGSGCAKELCEKMGLQYVPPAQRKNWSRTEVQRNALGGTYVGHGGEASGQD
jgi:hypothetical protein